MKLPPSHPSLLQRFMRHVAVALSKTPILEYLLMRLDRAVLALTRGRWSGTSLLTGLPTFIVTTSGAHSGQLRTVPLLGVVVGDQIILIASNFGKASHPAWYFNMRAHPEVQVVYQGQTGRFRARETSGEEARRCFESAIAVYPGYALYRRRAYPRQIPVLLLTKIT